MRIVDLRDAAQEPAAGGKAKALGLLLKAGVEVPPGFVVVGAEVPLSDSHKTSLLQQFDSLGATYVAVRSSAVGEDGNDATWAGQLDTFLNVARQNLIAKVEACLQSVESDRAKAYATQKHLTAGAVGVVVQAMVDSEVSGVAFSVHPVTQDPKSMIVEAGLGLGEAIVSGEITPDSYVIQKHSGEVSEQHIAQQAKLLHRTSTGDNEWLALDPVTTDAKLSPQQLQELVAAVMPIENVLGYPVDVEWAFASGTLYILQARPITTL